MAVDIFLKLDGITGESKDSKHGGSIDIQNCKWSLDNNAQEVLLGTGKGAGRTEGGGLGTGKVEFSEIEVTKLTDKSSAALMLYCANGKHIPSGLITFRKAGERPLEYLKIQLNEIIITKVRCSGQGSGGEQLAESVSLFFSRYYFTYLEQDAGGGGKAGGEMGWDLNKNEKI